MKTKYVKVKGTKHNKILEDELNKALEKELDEIWHRVWIKCSGQNPDEISLSE